MVSEQGHSVLIVEDERIVAKDLQETLRELGYDAFAIASSAEEAIARACERCPDLVLMDIRIKGELDGIETAEILRSRFGVPVVYLTAHADDATIERAKKTEPHGYLVKPVRAAELRSVVEVSLYKHGMERRLRERERWFSTTLRSIADAVITVDLAGRVTFMNPAAEQLTGVSAADASGKPVREVFRLVDEKNAGQESPILRALHGGHPVELLEGTLLNVSSGALSVINDSAAPVVDEEANQTLGAVMVFRDVTEQKKLQKQLELTDRLASLGTMAAGVAHEVNNPLAVVVANAGFLSEELAALEPMLRLSEDVNRRIEIMKQSLQDVLSAASRIGRIVSDLGAFSRPAPAVVGTIDVVRCVDWALRSTQQEFRHRARLSTELVAVPPVAADETRLGQVLINLLVNASQAIAPGKADQNEVHVQTRVEDGSVVITVRDTGSGIDDEVRERIFEPFFTTKPSGVGTGLGLSICHGIVASLGGSIRLESKVGVGTTIEVILPAAPARDPEAALAAPVAERIRGRILVIDDETMVLRAMARILRDHELSCTEDAQEALSLIEQGHQFDLILSDLMMPNMTGIEFYERLLLSEPELADKIVFLTGGAITERAEDFLQSVPNVRIEKPFEIGALQQTVQRLLAEQRGASGSN